MGQDVHRDVVVEPVEPVVGHEPGLAAGAHRLVYGVGASGDSGGGEVGIGVEYDQYSPSGHKGCAIDGVGLTEGTSVVVSLDDLGVQSKTSVVSPKPPPYSSSVLSVIAEGHQYRHLGVAAFTRSWKIDPSSNLNRCHKSILNLLYLGSIDAMHTPEMGVLVIYRSIIPPFEIAALFMGVWREFGLAGNAECVGYDNAMETGRDDGLALRDLLNDFLRRLAGVYEVPVAEAVVELRVSPVGDNAEVVFGLWLTHPSGDEKGWVTQGYLTPEASDTGAGELTAKRKYPSVPQVNPGMLVELPDTTDGTRPVSG